MDSSDLHDEDDEDDYDDGSSDDEDDFDETSDDEEDDGSYQEDDDIENEVGNHRDVGKDNPEIQYYKIYTQLWSLCSHVDCGLPSL